MKVVKTEQHKNFFFSKEKKAHMHSEHLRTIIKKLITDDEALS